MGTVPFLRTWVDGEEPTWDELAGINTAIDFLMNPPMCKVRQTVIQSIPSGAVTPIQFDTEDIDTDNMFSDAANTKITPKTPGIYRGWWSSSWGDNSTAGTTRYSGLGKNGSEVRHRFDLRPVTTAASRISGGHAFYIPMNGTTDYVELRAYQNTGAAQNTRITAEYWQFILFMKWWAPL